MGTWHLWHRLLWKEARESWPLLGISLALPLALVAWLHDPHTRCITSMPVEVGGALLSILITLWAVDRVHGKALVRRKARTQLPVPAFTRWLATYLLPLLIPLLAGIALGILLVENKHAMYLITHDSLTNGAPDREYSYQFAQRYLLDFLLYMLATFALSTTLAAVLPAIPAVMAGIVWLFLGFDATSPTRNLTLFLCAIGGALLGSLAWELCARRQWYLPGRVLALLLLAGLTSAPALLALLTTPQPVDPSIVNGYAMQYRGVYTTDNLIRLESSLNSISSLEYNKPNVKSDANRPPFYKYIPPTDEVVYHNLHEGDLTKQHEFEANVLPLLIANQHEAFLAQQRPHEAAIHLLTWDLRSDAVHEVMQFPVKYDALRFVSLLGNVDSYSNAALSPDGRYLLFALASEAMPGRDIWVLDLAQRRAGLVMANVNFDGQPVAWSAGHALLSAGGTLLQVDLAALHARYLDVPAPAALERNTR